MGHEVLRVVAWPIGFVLLGLAFLLLFRRAIDAKIRGISKLRLWRSLLSLETSAPARGGAQPAEGDQGTPESSPAPSTRPPTAGSPDSESTVATDRVWHAYWLGHDVMWSIAIAAAGSERAKILHGLVTSLHHAKALQLPHTVTRPLEELIRQVEISPAMAAGDARQLVTRLVDVKVEVGKLFEI